MATKQTDTAKARYDARTAKWISLKLNRNTDTELIAHLEQIENVQGYLKQLIREDMRRNGK